MPTIENQGNSKEFFATLKEKIRNFLHYAKELIIITEDTDVESTMASIKKSVAFRGINIWILFFAIIIASVGLNVNSTAVIIGAMLISPLMGPINGIGLAVGTFDLPLLRKSLRNLAVMVVISLFASTIYFILSPLSDAQSELLARTTPTIFDVLIATFGGFAGIVAASRKEQPFTVISGVAIATALMPPLCTAGFGLATLQFKYFFGAFYLFFINSFFIALATFIMVRYLHFPIVKFVDKKKEKIVKRGIAFFAVIVIIPSCFIAIHVVKETSFNSQIIKYVAEIQKSEMLKDVQIVSYEKHYDEKSPTLTLSMIGQELSEKQIDSLRIILIQDFGLNTTQLKIRQTGKIFDANMQSDFLGKLITKKDNELRDKEDTITALNERIELLQQSATLYSDYAKTIGKRYARDIKTIAIADVEYYNTDNGRTTTIPTIYVMWTNEADQAKVSTELNDWVPILLHVSEVRIISQNQ